VYFYIPFPLPNAPIWVKIEWKCFTHVGAFDRGNGINGSAVGFRAVFFTFYFFTLLAEGQGFYDDMIDMLGMI
jgi:hypothetical protein